VSIATEIPSPPATADRLLRREFAFLVSDVARLMRTLTDQKAREFGATRAQWAVLVRLERSQGLSQNDLAALLDVQPITLGRLIDKLCRDGLVERRPDPADRRINRLHLTPAAYPVLKDLQELGADMMGSVLEGVPLAAIEQIVEQLAVIKHNIKRDLQDAQDERAPGQARSS